MGTAASVIEKSDDYDDGNWHAKQPEQDRAAHERLLFCFRFEFVAPTKRASVRFVPRQVSLGLERPLYLLQEGASQLWNDPYRNRGGGSSARRGLASNERGASHALGRISEQTRATGATGADRSELLQLLQIWGRRAVAADLEAHPRNKDPVKKPFRIAGNPSFQTG